MDTQLWPNRPEADGVEEAPGPPSWRALIGAAVAALVIMGLTSQAAFWTEKLQEEVWLAQAEVEYRGDSLVETVAVAMQSPGVWGPIAVENGYPIKDFQEHYRAEVVGGTQALRVEFEDPDPEMARSIVQQVIDAYLEQFTVIDDSVQNETLERYLESLRLVETDLILVLEDTAELTRNEQIDRQNELIAVRQAITQVLLRLDGRASEIDRLEELQPRVISEPYVLPEPIEPEPLKMAVVGAGAGGLLAVAAAFFLFHRDEVRSLEDDDDWELAA